jgi:hypothetical protein
MGVSTCDKIDTAWHSPGFTRVQSNLSGSRSCETWRPDITEQTRPQTVEIQCLSLVIRTQDKIELTNSMELSTTQRPTVVRPLDSFKAFHGTRRFNIEFTRALSTCSYPELGQSSSSDRLSKGYVQVRGLCKLFVTNLFFKVKSC